MNIEEAIKKIKEIIYWSNGQKAEYIDISFCTYDDEINCEEFIEAIETVLNELDKKDKVIDLIVDTIVGDRKILKLVCNKIINKKEDECFEQNKLCDDCIKEYFYKKAEDKLNEV